MEWVSGNIFIRPNDVSFAGLGVAGHAHNFDHTTFFQRGWFMVRGTLPDGRVMMQQFCSPEYKAMRSLLLQYEPDSVKDVYRMPDATDEEGAVRMAFAFVGRDEPAPVGGVLVPFAPVGFHALIRAEVVHEIAALSDDAQFACVYSHREPQGDISGTVTGWYEAYL